MVKLGSVVKDSITGFEGVAVTRAEYLHEVPCVLVAARAARADGSEDVRWYAEARLVVISEADDVVYALKANGATEVAGATPTAAEKKAAKAAAAATETAKSTKSLADSTQADAYTEHKPGAEAAAAVAAAKTAADAKTAPSTAVADASAADAPAAVPFEATGKLVIALAKKNQAALIAILKEHGVKTATELKDRPALLANFHGSVERALIAASAA
jgi:subtilase-type serine protease